MECSDKERDEYYKYCCKCWLNNPDSGCTLLDGEEIYQCELYRNNHPEEVARFEKEIGRREQHDT